MVRMKRLSLLVVLVLISLLICGCSEKVPIEDYRKLQTKYDNLTKDYDRLKQDYYILEIIHDASTSGETESEENQATEPVECYSDEYVTISYDHCGYEYGSSCIYFSVHNKTELPLYFYFDSVAVDGRNLTSVIGGDTILAGCQGYISVSSADLSTYDPSVISALIYVTDDTSTLFEGRRYKIAFSNVEIRS